MKPFSRTVFSLAAAVACALSANAQSVTTDPVGFVTLTIAAGTGTTRTLTPISIPLLERSVAAGQLAGKITDFTANTITNVNADWTDNQLSTEATPHLLKITSGAAAGRTLLVSVKTANTKTTLTIDSSDLVTGDLTSFGIVKGTDTYQLFSCDTLSSLFGDPASTGIVGGSNFATADNIVVSVNGVPATYFYDLGTSAWKRTGLGGGNSQYVAIRPDSGILYNRLGSSPINLTVFGDVPTTSRKFLIQSSGVTYMAQGWPADISLFNTNIQNSQYWISSSTVNTSDTILVMDSFGSFRTFWFNGSTWMKAGLGGGPSNDVVISPGSSIIVNKKGTTTGATFVSQNMPYSL